MAHVAALYRYPVKGFAPEACQALELLPDGRVAGDRVLGFRFADTKEPDEEWSSKHGMLALVNTPGLVRLQVRFDQRAGRLTLRLGEAVLAEEGLHPEGRRHLCEAVAGYASSLPQSALRGHPERLPLRLVGDGRTPRYHDSPAGGVTLHGRASLQALAAALGREDLDEARFRSNIAVEGIGPWEEHSWAGRLLRIGAGLFRVQRPAVRCLATHANPETGERDLPVLTTLTSAFGQEQPSFAVVMAALGPAVINVGDTVEPLD